MLRNDQIEAIIRDFPESMDADEIEQLSEYLIHKLDVCVPTQTTIQLLGDDGEDLVSFTLKKNILFEELSGFRNCFLDEYVDADGDDNKIIRIATSCERKFKCI